MQVEILPGKELTNPPEVSFELLLVTAVAKRKQRDSRDSYPAPKYLYQKGDAVVWAEANMWVYRYGEISHTPEVSKTCSCYTRISSQQGRTCIIHIQCKIWYAKQPERENGKCDTGSRTTPYYR